MPRIGDARVSTSSQDLDIQKAKLREAGCEIVHCETGSGASREGRTELDAKGATLRVIEPEVTTAGDMGRMVITVLGMVADMELKFIRDRQRAGIEAAKGRGVYKGRQKRVDDAEIRRLASEARPKAQIARDLKVSRMTVYRALEAAVGNTDAMAEQVG